MRALISSLALVGLAACTDVGPFYCDEDEQCRSRGLEGSCTLYGHCAFDDPTCDFELRYDDSAGELAGVCVGDEDDFDPPGDCEPGPEFCADGVDSDCFEDQDPACPPGDSPDTAIDITDTYFGYVNVRFAGNEYTPSCAAPGGRDAFFEFTLTEEELVYLDTWETDFYAVLVLREGACADQGNFTGPELACVEYGCSEGLSQWVGRLAAGTYCVVVDQYDEDVAAFGGFDLVVNLQHGPLAEPLEEEQEGDTCPQGEGTDIWEPSCGAEGGLDTSYFFTLCEQSTSLAASTCAETDFEPVLHALDGYGDELACADGCSPEGNGLATTLTGPGLFYLVVDGDGADQCGNFLLEASY